MQMLKGKVLQQEWPCGETSLQVVPSLVPRLSPRTTTTIVRRAGGEPGNEAKWCLHIVHTHSKRHTSRDTHTSGDVLRKWNEENADSEDEDQSQCLAMEVDNQEIDDIMWEVFGDENMLLWDMYL